MPIQIRLFLVITSVATLLASCSSDAGDTSALKASQLLESPMTFDWSAPARLSVIETLPGVDSELKISYDVSISAYGSRQDQLLLTTNNVTPIEFNSEQIDVQRLPTHVQLDLKSKLVDYHSRPQLVVASSGEVVRVEGLEKSIRTMAEIKGVEQKELFLKTMLDNPFMVNRIENIATSVWGCWVTPWLDFDVPLGESVEQDISLVILQGATPVAAKRTLTNHGFSSDSNTLIHLEQVTRAEGAELAQAMLNLSKKTMRDMSGATDSDKEVADVTGIVTARTVVEHQVKLDPATMKPVWAKCSREFVVDSKDPEILPSRSEKKNAEYSIKWD